MPKQFILDLDASGEFKTIEEATEALQSIAAKAREVGLNIHGGRVNVVREREPIEEFRMGSDEVFRNRTAMEGTAESKRFERSLTPA